MQPVLTEPLARSPRGGASCFEDRFVAPCLRQSPWGLVLSAITARSDAARVHASSGWASLECWLSEGGLAGVIGRRRRRDPARILLGPIGRVDRVRAGRALRALSLIGRDGEVQAEGTSPES